MPVKKPVIKPRRLTPLAPPADTSPQTQPSTPAAPEIAPVQLLHWYSLNPYPDVLDKDANEILRLVQEMTAIVERTDNKDQVQADWFRIGRAIEREMIDLKGTSNEARSVNKMQVRDNVRLKRLTDKLENHHSRLMDLQHEIELERAAAEDPGRSKSAQPDPPDTRGREVKRSRNIDSKRIVRKTPGLEMEQNTSIKRFNNEMEQVRNERQEFQTMFENFDQKANQLFNILSTVLKSIKEMKSATIRNIN
jgi:hypothetical protein